MEQEQLIRKIVMIVSETIDDSVDKKIKYSISSKMNKFYAWSIGTGGVFLLLIIANIISNAMWKGKTEVLISTMTTNQSEIIKGLRQSQDDIIVSNANLFLFSNAIERIDPDFKSPYIFRGGIDQSRKKN